MNELRKKLATLIIPITKLIGIIKMPFVSKSNVFEKYFEIKNTLKPGDTILTLSRGHLSNIFNRLVNPGEYMHTAIYVGMEDEIPMVIDATGVGVNKRHLPLFLSDKDKICIVRPLEGTITEDQIKISLKWLENQIGKPYDYTFNLGEEKFYCSELNYFFYKVGNPDLPFVRKYKGKDPKPNDFRNAKNFFYICFEIID
jgi:uncharacterized protein YycO